MWCVYDRDASIMRWPWPIKDCCNMGEGQTIPKTKVGLAVTVSGFINTCPIVSCPVIYFWFPRSGRQVCIFTEVTGVLYDTPASSLLLLAPPPYYARPLELS